jgi:hypothetical protein
MPMSKIAVRAARNGGTLPRNPADLLDASADFAVPPSGFILTVSSCELRERTKDQIVAGEHTVYRACGGYASDGKEYCWRIGLSEKVLPLGTVVLVQGKVRSPPGEEPAIYIIDAISCAPYAPEVTDPDDGAKVPLETPEELLMTLAVLVEHHGIVEVLRALAAVASKP